MKPLESLTDLERLNPLQIREYCYEDGALTLWKRNQLTEKDINNQKIPYYCEGCESKLYFNLERGKRK